MPLTVAMLREIDAEMEFRECPQCVTCGEIERGVGAGIGFRKGDSHV